MQTVHAHGFMENKIYLSILFTAPREKGLREWHTFKGVREDKRSMFGRLFSSHTIRQQRTRSNVRVIQRPRHLTTRTAH